MTIYSNTPTINMEAFDELLSILEDDFYDLLEDFINDTPTQLSQLDSAIKQTDFKKIFAISHAQSGVTGNIGLEKFHVICHNLCIQAKEKNIQECIILTNALFDNFEECKKQLTEKINNH